MTSVPQAQTSWPDRVRLPLRFDPARLAADVARLEDEAWVAHFVRQNYEGDWSALPLRAHAGETHPVRPSSSIPRCSSAHPIFAQCSPRSAAR